MSPALPPLYFNDKVSPSTSAAVAIPPEVLHCIVDYSTWGVLAKLASVQTSWSQIMYDAADGSTQSKWDLAQAMLEGTSGLEVNETKAMELLLSLSQVETQNDIPVTDVSATNGPCFAPAMKQIATCYLEGVGVQKPDADKGLAWLKAAHDVGADVDAAHQVAVIYEYGSFGAEHDVVAAAAWFRKAALTGHMEAMAELGLCYELGCGVEQSDEEALEWYIKAAEKGHLTAKYSVGEAFEEARGVPQSDEEACLWYFKAAIEGDEDSRRALRRLEDIARIVVPGVAALLNA
jgi:TPR repeat protein|uniref:Uncharacterized protein n=1 Tax=Phaeodactylum tricornutum TaxID=2850 RepID=A0A8J9X7M7_PHATR